MNIALFGYITAVIYMSFCSIVLIAEFNRFRKLSREVRNTYVYNLNLVPLIIFIMAIAYIITYNIS